MNNCKANCRTKAGDEPRECSKKRTNGVLCGRHAHTLYLCYNNPFAKSRWIRRHAQNLTEDEIDEAYRIYSLALSRKSQKS